jgi:SOS-response transcriptional repressor LexA
MAKFTPTQGRYLAFIRADTNVHGYPPAEAEIAAAICVSPPSVNQMVKVLEKKGLIQRQPGQPRSIQVQIAEGEIPPWNGRNVSSGGWANLRHRIATTSGYEVWKRCPTRRKIAKGPSRNANEPPPKSERGASDSSST